MASPASQPHPSTRPHYPAGRRHEPPAQRDAARQPELTTGAATINPGARFVNAVLGAWLFLSAFLWPHADASRVNAWVVGALIALAALTAPSSAGARWINTLLGAWLVLSTLLLPHHAIATLWNQVIVGALVMAISWLPSGQRRAN